MSSCVAPKGPGHMVRRQFITEGCRRTVPRLALRRTQPVSAMGCRAFLLHGASAALAAGVIEATFARTRPKTDLFGEQAVLCGGLT